MDKSNRIQQQEKHKTMILIAIILPWLSFFLRGKILSGMLCLILQITLIGWFPAAIWAVASRLDRKQKRRLQKMEKRMLKTQIPTSNACWDFIHTIVIKY